MFRAVKEYSNDYLIPFISSETQSYHFEKHHKGYANTLNKLVDGQSLSEKSLEEIIKLESSIDAVIYNNAAQVFNHDFYWKSLALNKVPGQELQDIINRSFENIDNLKNIYIEKASKLFGSGWSWLVFNKKSGLLDIINTTNAKNLLSDEENKALLVIDLWEHAYYIDYRNDRLKYLTTVVNNCLNWEFATQNLNN